MNEEEKKYIIEAIEEKDEWTIRNNIEFLGKEIIIDYFPQIIDLIGNDYYAVEDIMMMLNNDEINSCIKKLSKSNIEDAYKKLYTVWTLISEEVRQNNFEFVSEVIVQGLMNNYAINLLTNIWGTIENENKVLILNNCLSKVDKLSESMKDIVLYETEEKLKIEVLKENPNLSKEKVLLLWGTINDELKDSNIFEIMDIFKDEEIKKGIWSNYCNSGKKIIPLVEKYKNNEILVSLISVTNNEDLKINILDVIEKNIEDTDTLLYIWCGLHKKEHTPYEVKNGDFEYIKEVENNLLEKLIRRIRENPDQMIFVWKNNPEILNEKIPNVFYEIYEKVKENNQLLIKLWINTKRDLQINYKDIFNKVVNSAEGNKVLLKEIWENTDYKVQDENEQILIEIVQQEKDNLQELEKIWNESSNVSRKKSFAKICKIVHSKSNIKEEELDKIQEIFISSYAQNFDIVKLFPIDFVKFFSEYNIGIFGIEKINLLACYPQIVKKINSLDYKIVQILGQCCNRFMQKYDTEEWVYLFKDMLDNIDEFDELINSKDKFTQEEIDTLSIIFQDKNVFELKDAEELANIDQIRKDKCKELIMYGSTEDMVNAICISKFGYSKEKLEHFLMRYGNDYEKISDPNLKYFMNSIEVLINYCANRYDTREVLREIYDEVTPVRDVNLRAVERQIKNEYAKLYDETLFQIEEAVPSKELGQNVYELPEDEYGMIKEFNMIVTVVAAFHNRDITDYYDDWNQNSMSSQHFCASYINKYMLGLVSKEGIHFGFSNLGKDSLVLLGPYDIGSLPSGIISDAYGRIEFYGPDKLLDKTR